MLLPSSAHACPLCGRHPDGLIAAFDQQQIAHRLWRDFQRAYVAQYAARYHAVYG